MNYKIVSAVLATAMLLTCGGCAKKKGKDISGKYTGSVSVSGENRSLGIRSFDAELPVYLKIDDENSFVLTLGFKELKKDLNKVVDDIEAGGVYVVKDLTITGADTYEGTVEFVDGEYVFSGDIDFTATLEDGTLQAAGLLGADIEFT